ncbi:MAG: murein transglycosylase A [Sulfuricellaceae bacterium]|nr:murein transglycosylase A [Sulfuricellaceae bacterium]
MTTSFRSTLALVALLLLAACAAPTKRLEQAPAKPVEGAPVLRATVWDALPGWREDDSAAAWPGFLQSCSVLKNRPAWADTCAAANALPQPDAAQVREFFEAKLTPFQLIDASGGEEGLITGYYEPLLHGSRKPSARYRYPVYSAPDDLLTIDMASVYPELKGLRLRGRVDGKKVVPYYNRAEIDDGLAPLKGRELYWVDDAVELFFLQIQGSGRIQLENGELVRVGYADQNGYPYHSIGKKLVESGELSLDKASMQGIKDWAKRNPGKLKALLDYNASYVFFHELPNADGGPIGALGVPLSDGRSVAVDRHAIPLGAPIFLATSWPNSNRPLDRLMLAQDTGGAIRGAIRADFFWGFGPEAGKQAGAMKQSGRIWLLWPKGAALPANGNGETP